MSYHLYPRDEPYVAGPNIQASIYIFNTVQFPYNTYNLEAQYNNNNALINGMLGSPPGGATMSYNAMWKHGGIFLGLIPLSNLTNQQYYIIFKAGSASYTQSQTFQIYHNSALSGAHTMLPGDPQFAILVDCDGTNPTYLFFNLANSSFPLFKEIEFTIV
jgi:hypothetical protein